MKDIDLLESLSTIAAIQDCETWGEVAVVSGKALLLPTGGGLAIAAGLKAGSWVGSQLADILKPALWDDPNV